MRSSWVTAEAKRLRFSPNAMLALSVMATATMPASTASQVMPSVARAGVSRPAAAGSGAGTSSATGSVASSVPCSSPRPITGTRTAGSNRSAISESRAPRSLGKLHTKPW